MLSVFSQNSRLGDIRLKEVLQCSGQAGSKSERKTERENSAHETVMGPSSPHQDHVLSCMRVSRKHLVRPFTFLPLLLSL